MATAPADDMAKKPREKLKRSRNGKSSIEPSPDTYTCRLTQILHIGCINCRTKHVKCDEKEPACGKCSSLDVPCRKREPPIPLNIRRRGYGPVKSRSLLHWEPPKIFPNVQPTTPSCEPTSSADDINSVSLRQTDYSADLSNVGSAADITSDVRPLESMEHISWSSNMSGIITSPGEVIIANQLTEASVTAAGSTAGSLHQAFDNSFSRMLDGLVESPDSHKEGNAFLAKSSFPMQSLAADPTDLYLQPSWSNSTGTFSSGCLDPLSHPFYPYTESLLPLNYSNDHFKLQQTAAMLSPKISYELADALNLTQIERKALDYHRNYFSNSRSIKEFRWSGYSIYLTAATNSNMILHLILAISLWGLTRDTQDASASRLSIAHLHKGLMLLQKQLERQNSDIVEVMISFWFLALFTMENDSAISRIQRHELGKKVYQYSRAYILNEVCSPPNPTMATQSSKENNAARTSMVMKILSMVVTLDVQLNIFGYGGELSDFYYEKGRMRHMQQMADNYLELNHGSEYPHFELAYDIVSSECSRAYHDQHRLYHWLNQLFWRGIGDYESIEKDIEAQEQVTNNLPSEEE
jgi:hypothetical protein